MSLIYFLGRFHVLVLHLPIAIILLAITFEWISRKEKYRQLAASVPWLWGAAALTAIVTVALGYMHFAEGGFESETAWWHRLYGTSLAILTAVVFLLHIFWAPLYRHLRVYANIILIAAVTMTGHYGGNLTHGSTYLVEYAPQPLRALAGLAPRRPQVTDLAMADPYHDIVAPMLSAHCANCHNDDKLRGGLNLTSMGSILTGGESGPAMVSGDPEASEIIRRVSLPENHEDFMPAEGKTPLSTDQVELLRWWITADTPMDVNLGSLTLAPEIEQLLSAELGLTPNDSQPRIAVTAADSAAIESVRNAGWLIRHLAIDDPRLIAANPSPGLDIGFAELALLEPLSDQLVELDLANSGIDDDEVSSITNLHMLRDVRLSSNQLSDNAIAALSALPALETLNIYDNPEITDASVETLSQMPALKKLFIWKTGLEADSIARLQQLKPGLNIQGATGLELIEEDSKQNDENDDVSE